MALQPAAGGSVFFSAALESSTIGPGNVTTLTYNISTNSGIPVSNIAFNVSLPASVTIANVANAQSTLGGTLTASGGGNTITFSGGILAPGGSGQIRVNITSATPGMHLIVSSILTSSIGGTAGASATLTVSTDRPGFGVAFSPSPVNLGQRVRITYTIDNSANPMNVVSFSFTNNLPAGLVVADPPDPVITSILDPLGANSLMAIPGSNAISFSATGFDFNNFRVLPAGAIGTVSLDVIATGGGVLNNITSPLTAVIGPTSFNVGRASASLNVTSDPVGIQMSFTNDPVAPGGSANLQFTISNRDRVNAATGMTFTLDLNAVIPGLVATGLPQTGVVGAGSLFSGTGVITLTGGNLGPGGSATFNVALQLPMGSPAGKFPFTTSSLTGNLGGSPFVSGPASDKLFIQAAPTLAMSYTNDPVSPGGIVALEFTITNTSSAFAATGIGFNVNLPTVIPNALMPPTSACGGMLTFTPANIPASIPANIALSGGSLASSASCTFTFNLQVDAGAPGGSYPTMTSNLTATLNGQTVTGQPAFDSLSVLAAPSLAMSFIDPVLPGATTQLNFTLALSQNAPGSATAIGFTVDLNSALTGLTAVGLPAPGCGGTVSGTGLVTFSGGTLAPGTNCMFSITVQIPAAAAAGNYPVTSGNVTATVNGIAVTRQGTSDILNVSALTAQAAFIGNPFVPGETATLRFTIQNQDAVNGATGISFNANLAGALAGLTPTNLPLTDPCGAGSQMIASGNSVIFFGGNLAASASCQFDLVLMIPSNAVPNTYQLSTSVIQATVGGGTNVILNPVAAQFTVIRPLSIGISFPNGVAIPGGTTPLRFTINNIHPTNAATGITFTNDLNAALPGLVAVGTPVNNVCGAGSQISGTNLLTLTGASLGPQASCTFDVTLQIPAGAPAGKIINTTSASSGTVGGVAVGGDPASASLNIVNDNTSPVLSYTPIPNSTANPTARATITDATGVASATIFYSINGAPYTSNPCTLASGTAQAGDWTCPIPGVGNPSAVAYYVRATDLVSNTATNPAAGAGAPNLFTNGAAVVPAGPYTNMSLSGGASLAGNVTVLNVLTLGGIVNAGANTVTLGCGASAAGGGASSYLIGNMAKQYCAPGAFTYPVGTAADGSLQDGGGPAAPEYSPFSANVTAVGQVPSTLTVSVTDAVLPGSSNTQSASRYWNVTETGDLTANISFTYLDQDVAGLETTYKVLRREGVITNIYPGGTVNAATNTGTVTGVTNFSQWAAGNLAPTAAFVNIGGRVLSQSGSGIYGARVYLTDSTGNVVARRTNPFGYYRFADVPAGAAYVVTVEHKFYQFVDSPRVLFVNEEDFGIDFVADGRE